MHILLHHLVPLFISISITLAIQGVFTLFSLFNRYMRGGEVVSKELIEKSDLTDKICLVTGCTSGIGLELVKTLYKLNATVIMGCRNLSKTEKVIKEIKETSGENESAHLVPIKLDLDDLDTVRSFCEEVKENFQEIHILVCNGVGTIPPKESKQGYCSMFQINYLGHFLMTNILLGLVIKGNGRIINTSSVCHYFALEKNLSVEYHGDGSHYEGNRYRISKLLQVLFTKQLAKRLRKVAGFSGGVVAVHPGGVRTAIFSKEVNLWRKLVILFLYALCVSPKVGAQTSLLCCLMDDGEFEKASGCYFSNCEKVKASRLARREKWEEVVWKKSERYVEQEFDMSEYY